MEDSSPADGGGRRWFVVMNASRGRAWVRRLGARGYDTVREWGDPGACIAGRTDRNRPLEFQGSAEAETAHDPRDLQGQVVGEGVGAATQLPNGGWSSAWTRCGAGRGRSALEPGAPAGQFQVTMDPRSQHRRPPVLDMTLEGEFRDTAAAAGARARGGAAGSVLDRVLARLGGVALLVALAAGGVLLVSLALLFIGLLLPVVVVAGAVGAASLWWRLRRLRRSAAAGSGGGPGAGGGVRFVVIRPR